MAREDFSQETRHVIAARAGFRCSYPQCNQLTIGPAQSPDAFENTGLACHIHAASTGGPRGQGGLLPEQIRHAKNGIWMCGDHSSLIDKKSGVRFPVPILQSWKALHEYRTSYEHSGNQVSFGFIRQLHLSNSPLFRPDSQVNLAKTTFIIGGNGLGKSALCEWVATIDTSRHLHRWIQTNIDYTITFDAPIEHRLRVVGCNDEFRFALDDKAVSRNHIPCAAIYLGRRVDLKIRSDLYRIMDLFRIEELALRSKVNQVSSDFITGLEFTISSNDEDSDENSDDDREPKYDLLCHLARGHSLTFSQLSSGEQGRVLLELAMSMAKEAAQFGLVVLLIEISALGMDWHAIEPYLALFSDSNCLYQTVVAASDLPTSVEMLGWQIYTIDNGRAGERQITPLLIS